MTTREENELLCRIGPETAMGNVFRRFWHPVCTSAQLPKPDCDPIKVRLLGQDFVAFRDSKNRVGLLDELCMHRGASLVLGRVEDCGIRCLFHGWKFGVDGEILDVPNFPDPKFKARHRANAYPVREAADIIWAYIGPKDKEPPFPHFPFYDLPPENRLVIRVNVNTNYLQNLEGGLDSSHSSSLHSDYFRPTWREGVVSSAMDDAAPTLEVEDTDFGYHYAAVRKIAADGDTRMENVRIVPFIMPSTRIIPGRRKKSIGGRPGSHADIFVFEVPADDENTSAFVIIYGNAPVDRPGAMKRLGLDDPTFWSEDDCNYKPTAKTRFGQNRAIMDQSWTGLNGGIYVEDAAVIGSMGTIFDRTKEHLVPADSAIVRLRRKLLDAAKKVQAGDDPPGLDIYFAGLVGFDGDVPVQGHWHDLVPRHIVAKNLVTS